jgi:PIN domain nuclease of toxin-antitoxin system
MILLDTHIWIWWVNGSLELPETNRLYLDSSEQNGLEISVISCWEVAMLVQKRRLALKLPVLDWITLALKYPGISRLNLSPAIVVDSTELPGNFHKDPVDQILVATARVNSISLMTLHTKILDYPHVSVWKSDE